MQTSVWWVSCVWKNIRKLIKLESWQVAEGNTQRKVTTEWPSAVAVSWVNVKSGKCWWIVVCDLKKRAKVYFVLLREAAKENTPFSFLAFFFFSPPSSFIAPWLFRRMRFVIVWRWFPVPSDEDPQSDFSVGRKRRGESESCCNLRPEVCCCQWCLQIFPFVYLCHPPRKVEERDAHILGIEEGSECEREPGGLRVEDFRSNCRRLREAFFSPCGRIFCVENSLSLHC